MHGSLTAKIYVLQNELKKKDNSLESRNNEVASQIQNRSSWDAGTQLDFAIAQATTNAERTEQLAEISKAKIAALETQLRQTELGRLVSKVRGDLAELFQGSFEIVDNFLGENIWIGRLSASSQLFSMRQKMANPDWSRLMCLCTLVTQAKR
jgi:tRNA G10  N-methylase Trm11